MGAIFGFFGGLLLFLGASCVVADALLLTIGGADTLFSLRDLWTSLHLPGFEIPAAAEGVGALLWTPVDWLARLPSWLVFSALGGVLMLARGRGRERTFG